MQTLNVCYNYLVRVIGKSFTLPKHKDIIPNSMAQTKQKWDSLSWLELNFWVIWRCHGISCFHFYFLSLEPMVKKSTWIRTISVTVKYRKYRSQSYLITAMFRVFSRQLRVTLATAFERRYTVEDFMEMEQHTC